jgi:cytochrome b6
MHLSPLRKKLDEKVVPWLSERFYLHRFVDFLKQKDVPRHRYTFWYLFGGLTLLFFVLQVLSGVLLLLYYKPTPETAFESVRRIIEEVPHGDLVRSIHVWSAHLMVLSIGVHMFSTYFMKAYRRPREGMWLSGFVLLILSLGFAFTGYLLPWDTTAYFATQIGTEIPKSVPIVGDSIVLLLRGGTEVNGETLTRLFALHVSILPLVSILIIGGHLLLNQIHGSSTPIGVRDGTPIPFFPDFLRRDWISWLIGLSITVALALIFRAGLGTPADPFSSAPANVRPEWYFWFLYQTLKIVPVQFLGISGEILVNVAILLGGVGWWMVPFLDRHASQGRRSRIFSFLGYLLAAYLIGMTVWAGLT